MEEVQAIEKQNSHTKWGCSNGFHKNFGHSYLFPAFMEEYEKNQTSSMGAVNVLKACLRKAGLPFDGSESLQLHACIFHQIFMSTASSSKQNSADSVAAHLFERDMIKFSSHDYFRILLDEELSWFKFYKQMLPFLKLQVAAEVVSSLEQFYQENVDINAVSDSPIVYVSLLTAAVQTMFNVIFDVSQDDGTDTRHASDDRTEAFLEQDSYEHSLCEHLCVKTSSCLEILLQLLDPGSAISDIVENDRTMLQCVVEIFSLTLMSISPFCSIGNIRMHLKELWVGRVDVSELVNRNDNKAVKNTKAGCEKKKLSKEVVLKNQFGEMMKQDECSDKTEGSPATNSQHHIITLSGIDDNGTNSCENVATKNDVRKAGIKNVIAIANPENEKSGPKLKSEFLLSLLTKIVPFKLFFKLVQYFSRGEDKIHKHFYNSLSLIIKDTNHVRIADHFICRKILFGQVEKLLREVTRGELSVNDVRVEFEMESFLRLLDGLKIYPDRTLFSVTPAEEVLASKRQLCGQSDLNLLKQAVNECMTGWLDLVSAGILNTDFDNWWDRGFYDVVKEKEKLLSTENNVGRLLSVLNVLLQQQPVCWSNVEKVDELMTGMFCRLPTCLQERVILLWSSAHEEKDWLPSMKEEEVVQRDVTTLLNRLTSETVHQLSSQVLLLCLYSSRTVLTQTLQVAVYNKGQVEPVVQLLREMPGICTVLNVSSGHSSLMTCLQSVLSTLHFDETLEENFVKTIKLLTQGYHCLLDEDSKTAQWNSEGVLSLEEVMRVIIMPVLDAQIYNNNVEMAAALAGVGRNEMIGESILPFATNLQCLFGLIQTVSQGQLQCLHGVVLVPVLTSLCVQNWPSVSKVEVDEDDSKEESGGWHGSTWHNVRLCLDSLIGRMTTDGSLDVGSIEWLIKTLLDQGLPALALVYPLVQQHSHFQMSAILELLVKEMTLKSGDCVLPTLLQLGQVNDAMCHEVVQLLGDKDIVMSLLPSLISREHLASVMSQILCQSLASDMPRVCRMLTCVLSQSLKAQGEWEELGEGLFSAIDWKTLGTDCKTKCLGVLSLTDGLIWVLTATQSLTTTHRLTAVSSYQAACQDLLKPEDSTPVQEQEELLVFMISQCCSIMCLSQCCSQVFQRLNVLALALLANLSSCVKVKAKEARALKKMVMVDKPRDDGFGDSCDIKTDEEKGSPDLQDGGKEKRMKRKECLNVECFLCLRDIVCCVHDASIQKRLMNQLKELWALVADYIEN